MLVLRKVTERLEAVESGIVCLVESDQERIIERTSQLLNNRLEYMRMATATNPYGDDHAAEKSLERYVDRTDGRSRAAGCSTAH